MIKLIHGECVVFINIYTATNKIKLFIMNCRLGVYRTVKGEYDDKKKLEQEATKGA